MEPHQKTYNRDLLLRTVAIGATPEELEMFIYLAQEYNLDPLKKEIFFLKHGNKATIITSRDGYLKYANTNDQFDGIESDVVYEGDRLTRRVDGSIYIEYGMEHLAFNNDKLRGAFSNVFRKDRAKAASVLVSLEDYYKETSNTWKSYPNAMILKVAEAMALKRAFSMSGLVTREEIDDKE